MMRRARSMRLAIFHHLLHIQLRTQSVEILYVNLQSVFNMVGNAALVAHLPTSSPRME
jgi:hypothetical protein